MLGHNIFDFVHPEDIQRATLEYSDTLQQQGENVPSVLRIRDANGAWVPFEIIANNQLNDPEILGVIFTARDVRYREEVEEAIRSANVDVQQTRGRPGRPNLQNATPLCALKTRPACKPKNNFSRQSLC